MKIINPTDARKNFYQVLKDVNENHQPVVVSGSKTDSDAVIISLEDWDSIQETLILEQTGVMEKVRSREKDESGFTNVDDIDWDNL